MTMMICNMLRFGRRQLHTIVSKEIIKPSSPTPSHLETYNFSWIDQLTPDAYLPIVIFYPNSKFSSNYHVKVMDMKNSLSQTLTQYYPFAGRLAKTTPTFIDCNDEGVEFLEAYNDKRLSDFLHKMQHEDLDQLFPYSLLWKKLESYTLKNDRSSPLAVQVNQFACGGIAVAVSLSHKVADGSSLCTFVNDWAIMTRSRSCSINKKHVHVSPIDPQFISFKNTNLNYQGVSIDRARDDSVTKSFIFPGSKLYDLKLKVIAMTAESDKRIMNLTRLEVLNWLLYKCALRAATYNNLEECFKPTGFVLATNLRNKMLESLPKTTIGNFYSVPAFSTKTPNEITPNTFIGQLRNLKMKVQTIKDIKTAVEPPPGSALQTIIEEEQRRTDDYYMSTSFCRYPLYEIDFGWGKPIKVSIAGTFQHNSFLAVDARNEDGIEVFVSLGKEDMEIFQRDPELLSFC